MIYLTYYRTDFQWPFLKKEWNRFWDEIKIDEKFV